MARFAHKRIQGSLWGRGIGGMLVGGVTLVVLLVFVPGIRMFAAISVVIGVAAAAVLYLYNKYVPVRDPEEDQVVLHLNDDPPPRTPPSGDKTEPR